MCIGFSGFILSKPIPLRCFWLIRRTIVLFSLSMSTYLLLPSCLPPCYAPSQLLVLVLEQCKRCSCMAQSCLMPMMWVPTSTHTAARCPFSCSQVRFSTDIEIAKCRAFTSATHCAHCDLQKTETVLLPLSSTFLSHFHMSVFGFGWRVSKFLSRLLCSLEWSFSFFCLSSSLRALNSYAIGLMHIIHMTRNIALLHAHCVTTCFPNASVSHTHIPLFLFCCFLHYISIRLTTCVIACQHALLSCVISSLFLFSPFLTLKICFLFSHLFLTHIFVLLYSLLSLSLYLLLRVFIFYDVCSFTHTVLLRYSAHIFLSFWLFLLLTLSDMFSSISLTHSLFISVSSSQLSVSS